MCVPAGFERAAFCSVVEYTVIAAPSRLHARRLENSRSRPPLICQANQLLPNGFGKRQWLMRRFDAGVPSPDVE